MATILLLNGPNLNLLGTREPEIYGSTRLEDIEKTLSQLAADAGHKLESFQSNAEHELVDRIHQAREHKVAMVIFNPAAFTHTSVALRDAMLATGIPFIEIHLSNIYTREEFRHHSFFSDIAAGIIAGFGVKGYELAMAAAIKNLE